MKVQLICYFIAPNTNNIFTLQPITFSRYLMCKQIILFIITILFISKIVAQDFSNKGKEFYIAYPEHVDGNSSTLGIYITSDKNATGTIFAGTRSATFSVTANSVTKFFLSASTTPLNSSGVYLSLDDSVVKKSAVKIVSNTPIVVYAHIINARRSGATLALPTPVLGTNYILPSHENNGNGLGNKPGLGELVVVATDSNTVVEINPTCGGNSGRLANVPFQIKLNNAGDCYMFQTVQDGDLSGTSVKSISTIAGGCKPIAVFSASTWSAFDCTSPIASGGDNLFQQVFPLKSWGKRYVTAPFINRPADIYRIYVTDITTNIDITENGVTNPINPVTFNSNGNFYEIKSKRGLLIVADKPISVVQFITSQTCKDLCPSNSTNKTCFADPEMVVLNAVEQTLNNVTFFSADKTALPGISTGIEVDFVNIIIPTIYKNTVKIDGVLQAAALFTDIVGTGFSYLQKNLTPASATSNHVHNVTADTGFSAIVYGYGDVESYGYNGGTNVIDLYQYVSLKNEYATVNFPATCVDAPFNFSITLPYEPISLKWDFKNTPRLAPNIPVSFTSPAFDSTFIKDGKKLYVYKLVGTYVFNAIGTYPITVTVNNPSPDGCNGIQEINYDVQVFKAPIANFIANTNGCVTNPVLFRDTSFTDGRDIIKYFWQLGDATKDSVKSLSHFYAAGTYTINYKIITDIGCLAQTQRILKMSLPPTANFGHKDSLCANTTITFIDSSTVPVGGTISHWYWDFGNGKKDTLTPGQPAKTTYANGGNYTVTLVTSASGCESLPISKQITVHAAPVVNFIMPTNVCLPIGLAIFKDSSSIADGTESSFVYNWNFGNGKTSTQKDPSTNYDTIKNFTVKLEVTSLWGCKKDTTKIFANIFPQPKANFGVSINVCLGDSTVYIDSSQGFGTTITGFNWSFDDGTTSTLQNPKHIFTTPNVHTATLIVTSNKGCTSKPFSKTTNVTASSTAFFKVKDTICVDEKVMFTDSSFVPLPTTLIKWFWNFGNGQLDTFNSNNIANSVFTNSGLDTVSLFVKDNTGCLSALYKKVINIRPKPTTNFVLPGNVCLPTGKANFKNSTTITDGTIANVGYVWNFGNGIKSTATDTSILYSNTGTFSIKLLATSSFGCTKDTVKLLSSIYEKPIAKFVVKPEICLRDTLFYIDSSNGFGNAISTWNYFFADGTTDTLQNPNHVFTIDGSKTDSLIITTNKGCISNAFKFTTIVHPLPVASFAISSPTCEKQKIIFANTSIAKVDSLIAWGYNMGNGVLLNKNNGNIFNYIYDTTGIYLVKLSVKNSKGCISDSSVALPINVHPLPKIAPVLPDVCLDDAFAQFGDTSSIADNSVLSNYLWNFDDAANATPPLNANTSTKLNPIHKYSAVGVYNLSLKITSINGCADSSIFPFTVNGSRPKANFVFENQLFCSNDSVVIKNTSTVDFGKITKVEIYWDTANNPLVFELDKKPNPNKIYKHLYPVFHQPATKTYYIKMFSYSGGTCVNAKTIAVTQFQSPKVSFNILPGICKETTSKTITQASETQGVPGSSSYFGQGVLNNNMFFPSAVTANSSLVSYIYTSNKGCIDSASQIQKIWKSPTANFGTNSPVCQKNKVNFYDSSVANFGNIILWTFNLGNGTTPITTTNPNNISSTFNTAATYTVNLKVTTDSGCTNDINKNVKVNWLPVVNFTLPQICLPNGKGQFLDSTFIGDTSNKAFAYLWNFGDKNDTVSSNLKDPFHKFIAVGPDTVQLIIKTKDGCTDSISKILQSIYPQPKVAIKHSPDTIICYLDTILFTAKGIGVNNNFINYTWQINNQIVGNNAAYLFNSIDSGSFAIRLFATNSNNCPSDTVSKKIVVNPLPILDLPNEVLLLEGSRIALKPLYYYGKKLNFLWTPNRFLTNDSSVITYSNTPENLLYKLTVTTNGKCPISDIVLVKVLKNPIIPNVFSPNGDKINDTWNIPFLNDYLGCTINIFDRYGQILKSMIGYKDPWDGTYNGQPLPVGTYYYIIDPKNGRAVISGSVTILR
jgi:gliding motility-associated-like protein